jgi:hypothetical protein
MAAQTFSSALEQLNKPECRSQVRQPPLTLSKLPNEPNFERTSP